MNKLKRILKSKRLFLIGLIILTVYVTSNITYTTKIVSNNEVQLCDQNAIDIMLDIFNEENESGELTDFPLNSEVSTETLQRYKLYYDMAFELCIHSYGYVS
jgi:hypothetical protein